MRPTASTLNTNLPTASFGSYTDPPRLSQICRAVSSLKPVERQALALKALGYAYTEIGELTEATYTAVNRRLTEGRAALRQREAARTYRGRERRGGRLFSGGRRTRGETQSFRAKYADARLLSSPSSRSWRSTRLRSPPAPFPAPTPTQRVPRAV